MGQEIFFYLFHTVIFWPSNLRGFLKSLLSKGARFPPLLKKRLDTEQRVKRRNGVAHVQSYCRKGAAKETWGRKAFGSADTRTGKPSVCALKRPGLENEAVLCTPDPRCLLQCFKLWLKRLLS